LDKPLTADATSISTLASMEVATLADSFKDPEGGVVGGMDGHTSKMAKLTTIFTKVGKWPLYIRN
jgi:hypothetical protein